MEPGNDLNQPTKAPVDKETEEIANNSGQGDNLDNPVDANEAQNVTDGAERLSGQEAEEAVRKANQNRS